MTDWVDSREARADLEAHRRPRVDKRCSADEAVACVADGNHLAIGGTLYSRTPMALLFSLLRAQRSGLTLSRPLICYEAELFLVTGAAEQIVSSWMGIGLRWGLSPVLRHYVESGQACFEEWSHLGLGLRYKAGAMGVPFLPTYTMLGSDISEDRGLLAIRCPYTEQQLLAVPSLNPDVAFIHVHRSDVFGNSQIDGYRHMDADMARAARRVVVSTEQVVSEETIRSNPTSTVLPHFVVDAVVEAPFGAYPHECYGLYEADTDHFDEYVENLRAGGLDTVREYVHRHVVQERDFGAFLDAVGPERLSRQAARAKDLLP